MKRIFSGKKGIVLSTFLVAFLSAGLVLAVMLVKRSQDIRSKAALAPTIYLAPDVQTVRPGEEFDIVVSINTGENQITGLDINVTFDPSVFQINSTLAGLNISNLNQVIRDEIDNTSGLVRYSALALKRDLAVSGTINALLISGEVRKSAAEGSYVFDFASTTTASTVDGDQNVIAIMIPADVNVGTMSK